MRKGFIDYEWATTFLIALMFVATGFSVFRLWNAETATPENPNQWLEACQNCLDRMNADIKFAQQMRISSETLDITRPDGKAVTYQVAGDSLKRLENGGTETLLMKGLQSGLFSADPKLKGFVSVLLLSNDKMAMPFFTSFAARGLKNP